MTTYNYNGSDLTLDQLKTKLTEEITLLRANTLDKFTRHSPGVSRVYQENILAATRYKSGSVSKMSNDMTPTDYLTGLGTPLGLHASQFADYILYENKRLGLIAYDVEKGYLDGKRLFGTSVDGNEMITYIDTYRSMCLSVEGA